jgi:hypothetical protein
MRDMKKEAKVEFGITITKPWSSEMYDHNEQVADVVKEQVSDMWRAALSQLEESLELQDEEGYEIAMLDLEWSECATVELLEIQRVVNGYGFGRGYTIGAVSERVERELIEAPLYVLNEIARSLELPLEKEFIGFN